MAFVSRDVAADIARVCRDEDADLVLMGFHKSVVGRAILGGTVHRVLTHAKSDVGVFVDRGFSRPEKVLIPYLGGRHDRLALELAARLARNVNASITVLHVVDPDRADRRERTAEQAVDRVYKDPAHPTPVTVRVVEDISPVDAVLRTAAEFDLVVIGVSEKWGLSSHLFGWRPERIAARLPRLAPDRPPTRQHHRRPHRRRHPPRRIRRPRPPTRHRPRNPLIPASPRASSPLGALFFLCDLSVRFGPRITQTSTLDELSG